ncbi:hypothetical protein SAMN05444159_6969 [Bradyrhizobium lablabi]|uniref:Uncharacterized protein n=1 Tax=Bradyrhizobium lablabi TaxID=722472 RepID=A0A1M7DXZ6_9BRAD|nr:hypothetical protein SAMN05444159_6969 [Bradyrhizobium lablabi]
MPPLWSFRRRDADQKKMLEVPRSGEGFAILSAAVPYGVPSSYNQQTKFTCNSNDMRS